MINPLIQQKKVKLKELQSIIGTLNFACSVVRPGRTFLRRLINLTIGVSKPFHHIRVNKEVKADFRAWETFLNSFNGKSFFIDEHLGNNNYTIATDAASTLGCGLVFGPQWTFGQWEPEVLTCHIKVLELYPIVLAIKLFSNSLCNKSVLILTDNEALVPIINKGTSKDSQIMKLIRIMVVQCLLELTYFW